MYPSRVSPADATKSRYSSDEVAAAGKVAVRTLTRWRQIGILPTPRRVGGPGRGTPNRWPREAIERAEFARSMLDTGDYTLAEVAEMIRSKWGDHANG